MRKRHDPQTPAAWRILLVLLALIAALSSSNAVAVEPDELLSDPKLEARARALSAGLRCLVCQNQSIDDSNAPLARDLRLLVRERLQAGDTDRQILDFVVARYGEFVLLRPPFNVSTLLLWLAPLLILGLAIWLALSILRSNRNAKSDQLSPDEQARLKQILSKDTD